MAKVCLRPSIEEIQSAINGGAVALRCANLDVKKSLKSWQGIGGISPKLPNMAQTWPNISIIFRLVNQ
jgi:hypothetical protein